MTIELLNEKTVIDYVARRDDLSRRLDVHHAHATEIGDGNLNLLFLVQDGSRGIVIKQTLPYVRSDHSWKVTVDSIFAEARGLQAASKYAGEYAPEYYGLDSDKRLVAMQDLSSWTVWRTTLMNRQMTPYAARDVGRFIADLAYHTSYFGKSEQETQRAAASSINPELEQITEDLIFTEPYFEHEHNSWVHGVDGVVAQLRTDEIRTQVAKLKYRFLTNAEALLHGDLHTNSVFTRTGNDSSRDDSDYSHVKVFDYEFGFYGPVAFDIGILWGNFLLAQSREWALSYRRGGSSCSDLGNTNYLDWLLSLYEESWNGFELRFRSLAANRVNRIFTDGFVDRWLRHTLVNSAGYAAAEAIRRVVGWAKVPDIETLVAEDKVSASYLALTAARSLLERFEDIGSSRDLRQIVEEAIAKIR